MSPAEALAHLAAGAHWPGTSGPSGVAHEGAPGAIFTRLQAGPVNDTWRMSGPGEAGVLRISRPGARALGLDRVRELQVLAMAGAAGLGPRVLGADPDAGLLLTEWLPGTALTAATLGAPGVLEAAARLLRRLHALPVPDLPPVDYRSALHRYACLAGPRATPGMVEAALARLESLEPHPRALCHHDPGAANFIRAPSPGMGPGTGPALKLVDWEYAGPGCPWLDLAVLAAELDPPGQARLLAAYQDGEPGVLGGGPDALAAWVDFYRHLARLWALAAQSWGDV